MLLKEEFAANITYLDPCITTMIDAAEGKLLVLLPEIKCAYF